MRNAPAPVRRLHARKPMIASMCLPSSNGGCTGPPRAGARTRRAAAYFWAGPRTVLGLMAGLIVLGLGGRAQVVRGVIEFHGGPMGTPCSTPPGPLRISAITFGHVILGAGAATMVAVREHEHVHVRQYEAWGPFFLLASGLQRLAAAAGAPSVPRQLLRAVRPCGSRITDARSAAQRVCDAMTRRRAPLAIAGAPELPCVTTTPFNLPAGGIVPSRLAWAQISGAVTLAA